MSDIMTSVQSFISAVPGNAAMLSVVAVSVAAVIGRLAFRTVKRFTRR